MMSVTRVLMPHLHLVGQAAGDQLLAELDELLAVDGGFLVGEDEEADVVVVDQVLDLVDHLLRIAHAVVAPELPLRAERAGEGAAARHVGDGDAHAERHVDVFVPFQQRPVGLIASRSLTVGAAWVATICPVHEGEALDPAASLGPAPLGDGADQFDEDLLALAAHDDVDPGRFAQHLLVHEGGVDAAQHPDASGTTSLAICSTRSAT
jgi:hypothetical protein